MTFSLKWLPNVLESAGLKVALVDGWDIRGRGDIGDARGVLCHHTAGPRNGNMPSLDVLIRGRSDLKGPLAQLGLGRDGTYYVIAAGRCNHAGDGSWQGITAGNSSFIGIEAENTGLANDTPWPEVQLDAYHRGVAAILKHLQLGAASCAGHKEFAPGRKNDPSLDMQVFRANVTAVMAGAVPQPVLIPPVEPTGTAGRATLRRGSKGDLVKSVQRKLGAPADGIFGADTEALVRALQRARALVPDGIVGPKTWAALDVAPAVTRISTVQSTTNGTTSMANRPWPNSLAAKLLAAYIHLKYGVSPAELMLRNPPMGAMPFFNNSASGEIRRAELGLVAGSVLRFLAELSIPLERDSTLEQAHADLLGSMVDESAPSEGMAGAIDNHFHFMDEAHA